MKFISIEEVIEIHSDLIRLTGGLDGIRDIGLLISAIEMPKATMFGEDLHESIFDKAAAYIFHIVCNDTFLDGNKRTGLATGMIFLAVNGIEIADDSELIKMACEVAQGQLNKQEISQILQSSIN
ncbi:MAG: type II toxin-antitoxin system death-on-curing family toxin [Parachlamydiaceae bacterium]